MASLVRRSRSIVLLDDVRSDPTLNVASLSWREFEALVAEGFRYRGFQVTDRGGAAAVGVQCTLFDKSPTKNWLVSLHQDLSVPVRRRIESPKCTGWSEKEGQVYVQPPVSVLEQLVAVRVHIDECPAMSGALRVVRGSHGFGRLDRARADELRKERGETVVAVSRWDWM